LVHIGAFGVPTMFVTITDSKTTDSPWPSDETLLWGNDQLYLIEHYLQGGKEPTKEPSSVAYLEHISQATSSAQRKPRPPSAQSKPKL